MGLYEERVLPKLIDIAMRGDEINALRAATLASARGRVLEIGFGTGLNARHYPRAGVDELVVLDSNPGMSALAERRLAAAGVRASHAVLDGQALPFDDERFDTVVVTFTLCSIADVDRALAQVRRVLVPGGQLLFCEHNLADRAGAQRAQRWLTPLWRRVGGGCHLDRDAPSTIERAGFSIASLERSVLPTGPVFGTIRRGVAVR